MSDTITLPAVGSKIKALYVPHITGTPGREWMQDAIGTVTRVDHNHLHPVRGGGTTMGIAVYANYTEPDGDIINYYATEWEPVTTLADVVEPGVVLETDIVETPEQARITALETEVHDLKLEINRIKSEAVSAIDTIGEVLIRESNDRGWCDEFDRLTEETNESLPPWLHLPVREQEYLVTWTDYVSIAVPRSNIVRAKNYDAAIREAQDCDYGADTEDVIEAIRCGGWESHDSSDYEAELN